MSPDTAPHGETGQPVAAADPGAQNADETADPPIVRARALSGRGPEGIAFGPIDLTVPSGGMHVLQGDPGSGRTSLLLAVAGRFSPVSGDLEVAGHTSPARIREVCAIAGYADCFEAESAWPEPHRVPLQSASPVSPLRACVATEHQRRN